MALNPWQKLTRVLPGKPFGNGADGDYSSATAPTMTYRSCSGSATSTTLTLGSSGFANGDIIMIWQVRGTGVGQWEVNKIVSGGGTASLTLDKALKYTYTDSGNSQAQAIKIPQYRDVTVSSGTWTVPAWNENTNGAFVIAAKGITITGNITGNGVTGTLASGATNYGGGAVGGGFQGGHRRKVPQSTAGQAGRGEGTAGARSDSTSANGNGGGGGNCPTATYGGAGGGGGGHASAGGNGSYSGTGGGAGGTGGGAAGNAALTNMVFGGGGGGGATQDYSDHYAASGSSGGGIIVLFAGTLAVNGTVYSNGANGVTNTSRGGGGGSAGGSILLVGQDIAIGTNKVRTAGSSGGGSSGGNGGGGSKGRIAVYYGKSLTGSISSTYYGTLTTEEDPDLVEKAPSGAFLSLI